LDDLQISMLSARIWAEGAPREDLVARVSGALRSQIKSQAFAVGTRLPGETEMAKKLGISRPTLREATRMLAQEGLLDVRHGVGTFVAEQPRHLTNALDSMLSLTASIRACGGVPSVEGLAIERVDAPPEVAAALALAEGASVGRITRVRLVDGQPLALASEYLSLRDAEDFSVLQAFDGGSLYGFLAQSMGLALLRSEMSVTAVVANAHQSRLLAVKRGAPLLSMREIHYGEGDRRILYSVNIHNSAVVDFTLVRAGTRT
jgi:GntR family transcriptional regulator